MSQDRKRAREARELARRAEVEAAAQRRAKAERRRAVRERLVPAVPKRRRRYGALPLRTKARLLGGFLAVQVAAFPFLHTWRTRSSVAVLTAAVLLVAVTTRRSTPR